MSEAGGSSPLVTFVVAVFNGDSTLQRCIDSVAAQTCTRNELIVIDGGSTDGSVGIIKANESAIADWVSEPDRGIYHAWNKGLTRAGGDWICFLGADDYLHDPTVLDRISPHLVAPVQQRVIYGQVAVVNRDGTEIDRLGMPWDKARKRFIHGIYCLPTPGVMFHRSLFQQVGGFDESNRIAGDYELLLRELKVKEPRFLPEIVVTNMQYGGISSRPENTLLSLREMQAARRKHGLHAVNLHFLGALAKTYIRLLLWRLLGEKAARRMMDWGRRLAGRQPYWTRTEGQR
jgi:glycosyltransferase involved in cell wall biosynthesis